MKLIAVLSAVVLFGAAHAAWSASQGLTKCYPGLGAGSSTTTCSNFYLTKTCNSSIENYASVSAACSDTTTVTSVAALRKACCFSCYMKLIDTDTTNNGNCRSVSSTTIQAIGTSVTWSDESWCSTTGYTPCYSSYSSCAEVEEDLKYCPKKCFNLA